MPWPHSSRILSEQLAPLPEPLACLLRAGAEAPAAAVAALGARALLDLRAVAPRAWPPWLAPHQIPAAERLLAMLRRYGGALLADAVGLGKSYVALAVALEMPDPFALVVPAVLVHQWRTLLARHDTEAPIVTHESLSVNPCRPLPPRAAPYRLFIVDEAHRFRNPDTNRYRALAKLVVGARALLVTATPVHNQVADLFHLFRLFLRDHDLTALGVPSLRRAAREEVPPDALAAVAARLSVARSRRRVSAGYEKSPLVLSFPERGVGEVIRAAPAGDSQLAELIAGIRELTAVGDAAALFRLVLLSQLGSSLAAFRASLGRYEAFLDLARDAAAGGRTLGRKDFQRLFPPADSDALQLTFLPLLLAPGAGPPGPPGPPSERDRELARRLRELSVLTEDPKADALDRLLGPRPEKAIVFVRPRATVRYLLRQLRGRRVAAVMGDTGVLATGRAAPAEVLRAFAPHAQGAGGAAAPAAALETDVLIATDLLSEGLNLQDAARVIHYDLPWTPARLAQRVGRIDRLGSPHARIEAITFLPPPPLERALALEQRLAAKVSAQRAAGAAQVEAVAAPPGEPGALDWCDRLQRLPAAPQPASVGACAGVLAPERAVALIVRIGALAEALVVTDTEVRADPAQATGLLERAVALEPHPVDRALLDRAIGRAAPLIRERLARMEDARWRAEDRDRLGRRLIPWVLTAARRAARRGDAPELARLDQLVSRLALGMTAGEELLLEELLARRTSVSVHDLLAWQARLPPLGEAPAPSRVELVAAVVHAPRSDTG